MFLPAQILSRSGITQPAIIGVPQIAGIVVGAFGAAFALWCIVTFIVIGRGTPAPFDPPRRLVTIGPYAYVRNPMYIGASFAVAGAALFYQSWALLAYIAVFLTVMCLFVGLYEEPVLRATFGAEYTDYCARVKRWWPSSRRSIL